ncbi:MAG: hypothetical protein R3D68_13695 [Hyphomicrobiaceae bacterium]
MKTLTATLATFLVIASFAFPAHAARTIWDQIQETAPLQPVFETLRDNAP